MKFYEQNGVKYLGRASYHRRSSKSSKKTRNNPSTRDPNVGYYRAPGDSDAPVASLKHSRSDYGAAAASFNATLNDYGLSPADSSTDSPSRSFHATLAKVAEESPPVPSRPPPRPPKPIQMRPEVNEYWIDGSPSKQRVTFGNGQQKVFNSFSTFFKAKIRS